jgi:hypothetical protein
MATETHARSPQRTSNSWRLIKSNPWRLRESALRRKFFEEWAHKNPKQPVWNLSGAVHPHPKHVMRPTDPHHCYVSRWPRTIARLGLPPLEVSARSCRTRSNTVGRRMGLEQPGL